MQSERFTSHQLAEVIRDLFRAEATGCLRLSGDAGGRVHIYFGRGLIELASVVGAGRDILHGLVQAGLLESAPEEYAKAPPSPAQLAELIGGPVSEEQRAAIRRESARALQAAFALGGGVSEFEHLDVPPCFDTDVPFTLEILIKALEVVDRWASVRRTLRAQRRALRPADVPLFPVECLPLKPEEGYLLGVMDGHATYEEIAQLFPGDADHMTRFVFLVLVLGIVEFEPALVQPFNLDAYTEDKERHRDRKEREMQRIDRAYQAIRSRDALTILGISADPRPTEMQAAFDQLKEAFAPDGFLPEIQSERREELQIIQSGLLEAYLHLQSRRMGQADRARAPEEPAPSTEIRRLESQKTDKQAALDDDRHSAEAYLKKAQEAHERQDFHATMEYCKLANSHCDQLPECHLLLADVQARNPDRRWQLRAEHAFKRACELDPWNPHIYLRLAAFYRAKGMEQRAARFEARAFAIAPSLKDGYVVPQDTP